MSTAELVEWNRSLKLQAAGWVPELREAGQVWRKPGSSRWLCTAAAHRALLQGRGTP